MMKQQQATFESIMVFCAISLKPLKDERYVVPQLLRPMLLNYSHNMPISGHLGAFKTWQKVVHHY
jgi:hypothetical protein